MCVSILTDHARMMYVLTVPRTWEIFAMRHGLPRSCSASRRSVASPPWPDQPVFLCMEGSQFQSVMHRGEDISNRILQMFTQQPVQAQHVSKMLIARVDGDLEIRVQSPGEPSKPNVYNHRTYHTHDTCVYNACARYTRDHYLQSYFLQTRLRNLTAQSRKSKTRPDT